MTSGMAWGLVAFYVMLVGSSALEKRWPVCLYWIGAAILTTGVLWMDARMEIPK
jgi:hypothetical protein